jgi:hypothetical protein
MHLNPFFRDQIFCFFLPAHNNDVILDPLQGNWKAELRVWVGSERAEGDSRGWRFLRWLVSFSFRLAISMWAKSPALVWPRE